MRIIILGAGQVGRTAAYHLAREEDNEVTVVDTNDEVLRDLQDRIDIRALVGNGSYPSTLEAAGARNVDIFIALTNSDEVNMVACQIVWKMFNKDATRIARIRSAEYTRLFGGEDRAFAIDVTISPEQLVTDHVVQLIRYPGALQVLDFADGRVRLVGVKAMEGGALVGQQLKQLAQHIPGRDARVAAIYRGGRSVKPTGDTTIEHGDEMFFIAAREDIRLVMNEMQQLEGPVRRIVIAGGGNIGFRLAQRLEVEHQVKVIERDQRRARKISEQLSSAIVLNGDAADEELLLEENIDSADVFVAVTNAEEANILSAMLAKRLGCHKVMALINRPAYAELVESGTIDVALSPQQVTIGSLLAHVRRGDVVRVHSLRRGAAEAIEAIAHGIQGEGRVIGKRVEEIPLPEGATIAAVVRGDEVLIAHHDTMIQRGDHVILFLTDRRHVEVVEKLFDVQRRRGR
ncbi:MAG TPA: Trk system potassium transporter TrkA [Steroidobacteraceae bacterium]